LHEDIEHSKNETESLFNSQRTNGILKAKNDELEQFVNIASHDLQEPIRTTSMMVQVLQKNYYDKFDEEDLEMLRMANDGLLKMRSQIRSLVEYSVIGRKRVLDKVKLGQIVEHCINELKVNDISSSAEIIISPLPIIKGYTIESFGIFLQLLSNSLKFIHSGTIPKTILSHKEIENYWEFTIADNGIGLDTKCENKVFGMFEKLHGIGSFPRLGVGLAL
jgi:light-regulated signal transduction histidine kinase (bacteriophytochrome)